MNSVPSIVLTFTGLLVSVVILLFRSDLPILTPSIRSSIKTFKIEHNIKGGKKSKKSSSFSMSDLSSSSSSSN